MSPRSAFRLVQDEVAVASRGQVEFWNTGTWERSRTVTHFIGSQFTGVFYVPSGRYVWMWKSFREAGLYRADTFQPVLLLPRGMLPIAFDPTGRYLAASLDAQRLQVWDLSALHRQLRELGLGWDLPQ